MSSIPLIVPDANPHERLLFADEREDVEASSATTPPRRHASLLGQDVLLLAAHSIQLVAFVQTLAGRWTFPEAWLRRTRWFNLAALDPWQYGRLQIAGGYVSVAGGETDSASAPFSYRYVVFAWAAMYATAAICWAFGRAAAGARAHPSTDARAALVRRTAYTFVQVVALPSATAAARLLHCRADGSMDTMNGVRCYSGEHWCWLAGGVACVLVAQLSTATAMAVDARHQLRADCASNRRHERLLRRRALEYENGVDSAWRALGFEWMASFRARASLTRPLYLLAVLAANVLYAFAYNARFAESVVLATTFCIALAISAASPVYRVPVCNALLWAGLASAGVACVLGAMVTGSPAGRNVWLQPDYLSRLLSTVYGLQAALWCLAMVYLAVATRRRRWLCWGPRRVGVAPVWPRDAPTPVQRKYVYDIKRAKALIGW